MRWFVSWTLFWVGDALSRVMNLGWGPLGRLYPLYNRLMGWSSAIQGSGRGPWQDC
jgi:hypothetical protein